MFGYAVGVLLPCSSICDQLIQRCEVLQHLADELQLQTAAIPEAQLRVWWLCADRRPPSFVLAATLNSLERRGQSLGAGVNPVSRETLEAWLCHSQAMIHLRFPEDPHGETCLEIEWLWERLQNSCAQPGWQTRDLVIDNSADRLSQQHTYLGSCDVPMPANTQRFSALQQLRQHLTPQPDEVGLISSDPRNWLLRRSRKELMLSDQRLALLTTLLSATVIAVRWATPSLAPSVLVLLVGAWLLAQQPRRYRSQEWWCLDQLLWVQDIWQAYGMCECPTDRLHLLKSMSTGLTSFDLTSALRSHQLWLWMHPVTTAWGREILTVFLDALNALRREMDAFGRQQRQRKQVVSILLLLAAVLAGLATDEHNTRVVELLLLLLAVVIMAVGLATPIPMLGHESYKQHRHQLANLILDISQCQRAESLTDPNLRAGVEAAVRRIGHEVVDLCVDALLSGRDWRRLLP
jgi:hypothetical protein